MKNQYTATDKDGSFEFVILPSDTLRSAVLRSVEKRSGKTAKIKFLKNASNRIEYHVELQGEKSKRKLIVDLTTHKYVS